MSWWVRGGVGRPVWCLMLDMVEGDLNDLRFECSLFGKFVNFTIALDVCECAHFFDEDVVV